jgi:hypothetical protein
MTAACAGVARVPGKGERALKRRARLQGDHVAGLCGIERGLEIAAGRHGDGLARGGDERGVEEHPRELGGQRLGPSDHCCGKKRQADDGQSANEKRESAASARAHC